MKHINCLWFLVVVRVFDIFSIKTFLSGSAAKRRSCFQYEFIRRNMVQWATMYNSGYLYPVDGYQTHLIRVPRLRYKTCHKRQLAGLDLQQLQSNSDNFFSKKVHREIRKKVSTSVSESCWKGFLGDCVDSGTFQVFLYFFQSSVHNFRFQSWSILWVPGNFETFLYSNSGIVIRQKFSKHFEANSFDVTYAQLFGQISLAKRCDAKFFVILLKLLYLFLPCSSK